MALRFLLDTNAVVAFLDGADLKLRDRWLATPSEDLALCAVVKAELWHGAARSRDPAGVRARLAQLFEALPSLPFGDHAAELYGELVGQLERRGRPIGMADAMIAATALADDLTVVTRNAREFRRVPRLRLVEW